MSKILYVASTIGHINNFHLPYIERLRAEGHTVSVMANGEGADHNIPFEKRVLSIRNLFLKGKIRKIIYTGGYDTVILNTTLAAFHVRRALKKNNRPKVINIVHGYLFSEHTPRFRSRIYLGCERKMAKVTDTVIVMNSDDLKIARDNSLAIGEVIKIDGMGAALRPVTATGTTVRQYTATEGKYLIGFVGELSDRKNQRFLICALPEIKLRIPEAELILVGEGEAERELRDLADKLGISDSVHFLGKRDDPCDFISALDLYVSASVIEGLPFNVLEALGCRKTVLLSDIKGHRDILEKTGMTCGFLYEQGNVVDFTDKVEKIYNGEMTVDPEAAYAAFNAFSRDTVMDQTYSAIRRSML